MHMKSIMLCYNLKGTKKGRKIGMLGSFLGFRVKYVEKEEYSKTIGVLTGLKEEVAEEASVEETSGTDNEKNDGQDGYAGVYGRKVDRFQIVIK